MAKIMPFTALLLFVCVFCFLSHGSSLRMSPMFTLDPNTHEKQLNMAGTGEGMESMAGIGEVVSDEKYYDDFKSTGKEEDSAGKEPDWFWFFPHPHLPFLPHPHPFPHPWIGALPPLPANFPKIPLPPRTWPRWPFPFVHPPIPCPPWWKPPHDSDAAESGHAAAVAPPPMA